MAGKLKDDHIRIILDVEATGVQAELQKITASSVGLANANKTMKKEMKLLEKQGLETSKAYQNYENTLESARAEVEDYTRKIAENEKAIAANEKKHIEIVKTMNIEEMTMSQLKQRASELEQQMRNTLEHKLRKMHKSTQILYIQLPFTQINLSGFQNLTGYSNKTNK